MTVMGFPFTVWASLNQCRTRTSRENDEPQKKVSCSSLKFLIICISELIVRNISLSQNSSIFSSVFGIWERERVTAQLKLIKLNYLTRCLEFKFYINSRFLPEISY